ncbi:protein FAM114A2 [Teleopsis dalmanni]|uniref:protein FAM114A2 n=1 Tax=Teleopsis dalmanni TaxID=139649 RepID=UPI0018CEFB2C|nr:protein FAM114A2 [Teleopsis dalmanni]
MSIKTEKIECTDDNDDWDDWGDAEDNFPVEKDSQSEKAANFNNNIGNISEQTKTQLNQQLTNDDINYNKNEKEFINKTETKTNSWNVWKVLSTATEGIGNITTSVTQGLNQVIGVPDPEELARINACEGNKVNNTYHDDNPSKEIKTTESLQENRQPNQGMPIFGLSLVNGVTTLGSKVINTGLDTLEGIGKKTMNMLQENDPLLMNKRKMLGLEPDRPNLSEVLKEAKKDADQLENQLKELNIEKSKDLLRFDVIFENKCGLVHFEALEILSKESNIKILNLLSSVSGNALTELKETIDEVKELLDLEDLEGESDGKYSMDELNVKLSSAIEDADLNIKFNDISSLWAKTIDWLENVTEFDENEIFSFGLNALSETCALEMTKLHKIGECLLIKEHHSTASEVDAIVQICKQFNVHLNGLTNRYAAALTAKENINVTKPLITTLFAEMITATTHIENAFKLFLPILQIGAA